MSKILIVYWSTTWNTQAIAEHIQSVLFWSWNDVSIFNWSEISPQEIKNYEFTFLWSSTWWDWDMQDDMLDFVENLKSTDLSWVKIAVFACWMSSFPKFCHAWDIIEETVKSKWAILLWEVFKIDWDISDELDNAWEWAMKIISN